MKKEAYHYHASIVGWLLLEVCTKGATSISFVEKPDSLERDISSHRMEKLVTEMDGYFAGKLMRFTTPVFPLGGSAFARKVWDTLMLIPYGETKSYSQVAALIGRPLAHRAVGSAVGSNEIPIIIPCHRVVRSDGTLGGYGPGIEFKKKLLHLEKAL
ncbi:MAG: methylated-DNA-[protein]-cysteine S-methyltransferase [Thermodesulfobacteriota bacterium]|nr:methylated-DNA-[protein]-cysteine S-methyltransferase [Thermodesulfobacteriota bacterium]